MYPQLSVKRIRRKKIYLQEYTTKRKNSRYTNITMHLPEIKERTLNHIRMNHTWSGITKNVEKYISKCEHCQKNKLVKKAEISLKITNTPDKPFEKCALDIVGSLTITSTGNKLYNFSR